MNATILLAGKEGRKEARRADGRARGVAALVRERGRGLFTCCCGERGIHWEKKRERKEKENCIE